MKTELSLEDVLAIAESFRLDSIPGVVVLTDSEEGLGAFRCSATRPPVVMTDVTSARLDGRPVSRSAALELLVREPKTP